MENIFFPTLDKENIKTVIHLGDLVDRRKFINSYTAHALEDDFIRPLIERDIETHFIIGNHDTFFKNTNDVNLLNVVVPKYYDKFKIYANDAEDVVFDGTSILFIPWICDENRKRILDKIDDSKSQIAMGHLEIQGFEMYRGSSVSHGDDRSVFSRFDMVFSGHYHHRSTDGSIFYLGSHGEFTWSDYDDPRGFHIFDTETRQIEFIRNPYSMFKKIQYDDVEFDYSRLDNIDFNEYKDTIVKVVVANKTNPYLFDRFIETLEAHNPIVVNAVEEMSVLANSEAEQMVNEAEETTLDMFVNTINAIDQGDLKNIDKEELIRFIVDLHNEAQSIE